jgi:hypothetical protein
MAISTIGAASSTIYQPIDSAGTYTLSTPIQAGAYAITGDSTQTLTFILINALGYRFEFTMRGGRGRVYVPVTVASIIAPAGTYPINLGFEKMNLTLPETPAATFAWNANPSGNATGKFTFTVPSGVVSTRVYWEDGTNEVITSGADVTPKSFVTSSGQTRTATIVHKNAIGVESAGQVLTTPSSLLNTNVIQLTSSGTFTVPAAVTSIGVLVVAGGGSGGSGGNSAGAGGGGGAGGLVINNSLAVTPGQGIAYTIGAGGAGSNQPGNSGGNSVFGSITATGGGRGGGAAYSTTQQTGGSGGGAAGTATASLGAAGTAGQGNKGGDHSPNTSYDGGAGGGGFSAAGTSNNSTNNNGAAGGAGYALNNFASSLSAFVAAGGGGGAASATGGAAGSPGAGRGADNNQVNMTSGTANTGSGGGGAGNGSNYPGGNGGSGVIYVKYAV